MQQRLQTSIRVCIWPAAVLQLAQLCLHPHILIPTSLHTNRLDGSPFHAGGLALNSLGDAKGTAAQQDITSYHSALEGNENAAAIGHPHVCYLQLTHVVNGHGADFTYILGYMLILSVYSLPIWEIFVK